MLIDITMKLKPEILFDAQKNENTALAGHLGTHFDIMNKEFPLCYTKRKAIAFDVSSVHERDISIEDIDIEQTEKDMFVAFYSGYIEKVGYGNKGYFSDHPQLSHELIDALLERGISIIALDFAGVRRGKEHTPTDQYCADRGVFIIENLCNMKKLTDNTGRFIAHTYPMNFTDLTGLPCRVIAEI